jgi:TetR/AcrR family transcriptional repressor of mexJK operon
VLAPQRNAGVEETRARILAATRQIFERNGTRGTTTREVAERAGVNEATLFRHFGSKAALLSAMREEFCGLRAFRTLVTGMTGADIRADLTTLAHHSVERMLDQRALMCISLAEDAVGITEFRDAPEWRGPREMLALMTTYLSARVAEGRLNGNPDFLARTLMGMMFQLVVARTLWFDHPIDNTTIDELIDVFLNGVLR